MRQIPLLIGLMFFGCAAPPPAPEPTATPTPKAVLKTPHKEDLVTQAGKAIFRTKKGKLWLMEAFNVRYNDGKQQAHLDNVDWTLSDAKGRKKIRIQAPRAVYRMETETVEFEGQVQARRYDTRELLKANKVVWDGKTGVLRGSQGVSWVKGVTKVQGDSAVTNDKLDHIVVDGHVKVTTVLEGDPFDSGV
ncbi:LPS export ABC transporter periplasmic protein LptC [bacterium]|nr:LPS export ABC transporter periplasmic protein LptC [bacterium]